MPAHSQLEASANGYYCGVTAVVVGHWFTVCFMRVGVEGWSFCLLPTAGSHGMEYLRQEYWSGLPFPSPGDLPDPGIAPKSLMLQGDSLPSELPGKSICISFPKLVATLGKDFEGAKEHGYAAMQGHPGGCGSGRFYSHCSTLSSEIFHPYKWQRHSISLCQPRSSSSKHLSCFM